MSEGSRCSLYKSFDKNKLLYIVIVAISGWELMKNDHDNQNIIKPVMKFIYSNIAVSCVQ